MNEFGCKGTQNFAYMQEGMRFFFTEGKQQARKREGLSAGKKRGMWRGRLVERAGRDCLSAKIGRMQETIPDAPQASNGTSVERVKRKNTTDRKNKKRRGKRRKKKIPQEKNPQEKFAYVRFFLYLCSRKG